MKIVQTFKEVLKFGGGGLSGDEVVNKSYQGNYKLQLQPLRTHKVPISKVQNCGSLMVLFLVQFLQCFGLHSTLIAHFSSSSSLNGGSQLFVEDLSSYSWILCLFDLNVTRFSLEEDNIL